MKVNGNHFRLFNVEDSSCVVLCHECYKTETRFSYSSSGVGRFCTTCNHYNMPGSPAVEVQQYIAGPGINSFPTINEIELMCVSCFNKHYDFKIFKTENAFKYVNF